MPQDPGRGALPPENAEIRALAELALCESLAQTSGWAARWSAELAGADAALLWAPDALQPAFLCIAAHGAGTERALRRSVPRETGVVHDLVRDRKPLLLEGDPAARVEDPFLEALPERTAVSLLVPLQAERLVTGLLALAFDRMPDRSVVENLQGFLRHAAPALARALRAERKTAGMLHAIERLTSLYDLTKAFGSTIDLGELSEIIARKAADFTSAEVASLWALDPVAGEVTLAATAVNETYDVAMPEGGVGAPLVGDLLANREVVRRNGLPPDDPLSGDGSFPVRSVLALPLVEDDVPVGALVVANKRGRNPEFTAADEELIADLERQAVRALHHVRQYEAEKKVAELDALLAVSREITSTLDLDKVMRTIVNATSALIRYDRCAIAILQRGALRVGAVSGAAEVDRKDPSVLRTEALLEWVYFGGSDVAVTRFEDGTFSTNRPETEEKFRTFFDESGRNAFLGVLLEDDEGKLGVLGFESTEPIEFDEETRDLLQILVNQATVAVRNAQLYQQVPLPGFLRPLAERTRKLRAAQGGRAKWWAIGGAAALLLLAALPWNDRVAGSATVLPGRRISVTAPVEGVVESVERQEGDLVLAGAVVATLRDDAYRAAATEARAAEQIADAEVAHARAAGDAAALFAATARRDEMHARAALAEEKLERTRLRAPEAGIVVTPRLEERIGQFLPAGAELAVLAETSAVLVDVAVPETDAARLATRQEADVKLNAFPGRTFRGAVVRVGAAVREEGKDRVIVAEALVQNPDGTIRPGMLGRAKISTGRRRLLAVLLEKPVRWVWLRLWPLLP